MNLLFISEPVSYYNHIASGVRLSVRPSVRQCFRCYPSFLRNGQVEFNQTWYSSCSICVVDARYFIFEMGSFNATWSSGQRSELHNFLNISQNMPNRDLLCITDLQEIMYGLSFDAMTFDLGPRSKVKQVVLWICHILGQPTCLIFNIMNNSSSNIK